MELLVGDSVLSNSFAWEVAEVALAFSSGAAQQDAADFHSICAPKAEIKVSLLVGYVA